ncbi:hypothetical protein BDQ94DRAFT_69692 [Aspergillus welwitschiae]|uniref:Uncharacterized protein n=1 Tax=Aspergillus welwitschiae TaxID=1341132 RepID=A0A3F3PUL0_9EURO|nr:hypothetical protein BDQ94DRAFT_69692 [Aspergillus welwitschiae]RDH30603.1 hypothetical protein BDQ94DRAFT_69692 [Aspergillus welwitschiae]
MDVFYHSLPRSCHVCVSGDECPVNRRRSSSQSVADIGVDHDRQQNSNGSLNWVTCSGRSPRGPFATWLVATSPSSR